MFSIDHLNLLRLAELERVVPKFRPGARILEIGAGTGQQALELSRHGFDVAAVEVPASVYAGDRLYPIIDYDGTRLPFSDASFDAVFSSNALEHVRDLAAMHREILRVLKPGGACIHVLPTHAWRFWTMVASFPNAAAHLLRAVRATLVPGAAAPGSAGGAARTWRAALGQIAQLRQPRHGERGTGILELWLFHPRWWRHHFAAHGFAVAGDEPVGIFYTGHMLMWSSWGVAERRRMARWLGSASHLYVLERRRTEP
jgi:SAM-dependent methyltransferase